MSQFDANKDYYAVLGVDKDASPREIYRQYKRQASQHHPDRGGNEEQMKSLNEAYRVLKDATSRQAYDDARESGARDTATRVSDHASNHGPVAARPAREVGVWGQGLSALLCLIAGLFLLLLVRMQWMWFLWPLAILAVFVTGFGVLLARSVMVAANDQLPVTNRFKRHTKLQELAFWTVIVTTGYGLYWLLSY